MLCVTDLVGFGLRTRAPTGLSTTLLGEVSDTTAQTTYSFGNFTAPTAGLMVVCFQGSSGNNGLVNSVSIGGTNGTVHTSNATSGTTKIAIASRVVTAGAQAVTVTLSAAQTTNPLAWVAVYILTGYTSATPDSAATLAVTTGTTCGPLTLTAIANSLAFYVGLHAVAESITWSVATRDTDTTIGTTTARRYSSAHKFIAPAGSDNESMSFTTSGSNRISGACWH